VSDAVSKSNELKTHQNGYNYLVIKLFRTWASWIQMMRTVFLFHY